MACPDGVPRLCGESDANIYAGYLLMRFNLDSRITTLAFRNPAITIATFGEQAMD